LMKLHMPVYYPGGRLGWMREGHIMRGGGGDKQGEEGLVADIVVERHTPANHDPPASPLKCAPPAHPPPQANRCPAS